MKQDKLVRRGSGRVLGFGGAIALVAGLGAGLGAFGCAQGQGAGAANEGPLAAEAADQAEGVSARALEIDALRRSVERGGDARAARRTLEGLLAAGDLTPAESDQAKLALAHAHAALGEAEPALALLEGLVATHGDDRQWELESEANELLAKLLTGKSPPATPGAQSEPGHVAPFARALARFFPLEPGAGGKEALPTLHLDAVFIGGNDDVSTRLGTFNLRGAAIEARRAACSLCPEGVRSDIHTSRSTNWLGLPRARSEAGRALVVVYMDLADNRVPARYEEFLPLPVAEIERRLTAGEGLYAVKEREGAPPLVLVAAPRRGQLADVEEALAKESEWPAAPVAVELKPELRREEIQETVRASRPAQIRCYEGLLAHAPKAEGRIAISFAIEGGKASEVNVTTPSAALDERAFLGCITTAFEGLVFPVSSARTTVTYPIELTP